ncbi:kinesin-like protein KIF9 [Calliopsis andreniformis]|uniref:kinesin-like protein KIF9 n=1 Tax=Calliopsis andreniformis TaxID=337506 RepID=UPI003FCE22F9
MTDSDDANVHKKNINIFVRILPLEKCCESCARVDNERKKIFVRCLQEMQPNRIVASKEPTYWCFKTDKIFYDSSQEDVYYTVTKGLVSKILDGANCVLIGYGQTGSGKSFTITGLRNNWEHRGLVARLLSDMFAEKSTRKRVSKIQYGVSFVELHGKETKDLLFPETENKIAINDRDPFKEISITNVDSEEEALRKIFEGESRRSMVKGSTYSTSHLATSVITIHVSNISLDTSWDVMTTAKETERASENQLNNRKRTRSSSRPLIEVQETPKEVEREEVGSLAKDTAGMTFGPYTKNEEEKEETDIDVISRIDKQEPEQIKLDNQKAFMVRMLC